MKINKNSWHYKFLNNETKVFGERFNVLFDDDHNYTLCEYIGMIFKKIRNIGGIVILYTLLSVLVECMVLLPIIYWLDFVNMDSFVVSTGIVGWSVFLIFVFCVIVYSIYWCTIECCTGNNIFVQYLKAKKDKYCPIVEFVEE